MRIFLRWLFLAACTVSGVSGQIRVLIIDGVNNHDWQAGTAGIQSILREAGGFQVDVETVTPETFDTWRPEFGKYSVVINNFNGGHTETALEWPERVRKALEAYVEGGGGLVAFHAANNSFPKWRAYNEMIGLGWRDPSYGPGLVVGDDGKIVVIPQGAGLKPGHPARLSFEVHVLNRTHPITKGLPDHWMQPMEQLTHGQHGPAEGLTILTYAHSPVSNQNEPMDWVRDYGKGRVYVTMLGHTWKNEPNPNLAQPEFRKLFSQGVRWASGH
jgi:type 1 glutamine amidotransferase